MRKIKGKEEEWDREERMGKEGDDKGMEGRKEWMEEGDTLLFTKEGLMGKRLGRREVGRVNGGVPRRMFALLYLPPPSFIP